MKGRNLKKSFLKFITVFVTIAMILGTVQQPSSHSIVRAEDTEKVVIVLNDNGEYPTVNAYGELKPTLSVVTEPENVEKYVISYGTASQTTTETQDVFKIFVNGSEGSNNSNIIVDTDKDTISISKIWFDESKPIIALLWGEVPETTASDYVTVDSLPTEMTNQNLEVKVTGLTTTLGVRPIQYTLCESSYSVDWGKDLIIEGNGTYKVYALDELGRTISSGEINVTNIDKDSPVISGFTQEPESGFAQSIKVTVNVQQQEENLMYKMDSGDWQSDNFFVVTDNNAHTFYVKDALGNESTGVQYTVSGGQVDLESPVITDVTVSYGGEAITQSKDYVLSSETYTFTVSATDTQSGVKEYIASNGETTVTTKDGIFKLKGGTYTFIVKDNVGNESKGQTVTLKVDDTKPEITEIVSSNSNPTNQPVVLTISATDTESGIYQYGISDTADGQGITWQSSDEFTIADDKVHYFYVMNNVKPGNISEPFKYQVVNYNTNLPTIENIEGTDKNYTNESFTVTITGKSSSNAANTEFEVVEYAMDSTETWQQENTFTINDAIAHQFYVKDSSGNISEPKSYQSVNYDVETPDFYRVEFSQKNDNFLAEAVNFLSFGHFFNKEAVVSINAVDNATDTSVASGIYSYTLYFYDINGQKADYHIKLVEEDGVLKNTAVLDQDFLNNFKGTMTIRIEDKAGNITEAPIHSQNSNLEKLNEITDGQFMIENNAPALEILSPTNESIYPSSMNIDFTVSDVTGAYYAGIAGVEVSINESIVMQSDYTDLDNQVDIDEYLLSVDPATHNVSVESPIVSEEVPWIIQPTNHIENWNNGQLNITVTVYDNAGNATTKTVEKVYFDQTAPLMKDFEFKAEGEASDMDLLDAVQVTTYGFYFKQNIEVTVSAEDIADETETIASGVESMHIYLEDHDNGQLYTVTDAGTLETIDDLSEVNVLTTSHQISFVIPANFKGQIYAFATDKVGNMPIQCVNNPNDTINDSGYVHPDGTIVEDENKHKDTSAIEFVVPQASGTENSAYHYTYNGSATPDKVIAYANEQLVPLYGHDPIFGVKATDTYSGIHRVQWTKIEDGRATKNAIEFDYNGVMSGDTAGWNYTTESNLVTSVENRQLTMTGNYNDMVLLVELTDNAGNVTYDYYVFGIDKTIPQIDITYDNNDGDTQSGDGAYFDANRSATIQVTERNFKMEDVVIEVMRDGQAVEIAKNWQTQAGTGNKDNTQYTMHIPYVAEGDYTFAISYKDNAGHQANVDYTDSLAPVAFTIDKTAPVVEVSYNNNTATNGQYFNDYRTATIAIFEHNFDVNRVHFTQTASLNGQSINVPGISWNHNGDTHIATIAYNADGDYTFDMTMDDKAGNVNQSIGYGNSVAGQTFTVDTTIEKPIISGVANGAAYREEVIPTIEFNDVNFDVHEIRLTRTRMNEHDVDVTAEFIRNFSLNTQGGTGTNDTFEMIPENDGIYTLYVRMIDLAGNEESETITFSVNRFGSVYEYNEALSDLIQDGGAYVQSVDEDLVITEYNPNQLVEDSLLLDITRDGNSIENVKVTISPVINQYAAIGTSGWYQYEYVMSKDNFVDDGIYRISVSSQDTAGNMPENSNFEDMNILFRVDDTKPELTSIAGLEKNIINATSIDVNYDVYDAIGLKSIQIYVDGGLISQINDFSKNMNNYSGQFTVEESSQSQNIRILVEDMAGNVTDTSSEDFTSAYDFNKDITVSTNFFVRWYANKPLFFGSIAAVLIVAGCAWFFIAKKRRKDTVVEE